MALKYPFTVEGSLEIVTPFVSSTCAFFFFAIPMDCPTLAPTAKETMDYHRNVTGGRFDRLKALSLSKGTPVLPACAAFHHIR